MASIVKRGGSWVANIRRKGFPSKSKSFPTKALATKWAHEAEAALYEARTGTSTLSSQSLSDIIDRYFEDVGSTTTFGKTKESVLHMLDEALGSTKIKDLTTNKVMEYVHSRLGSGVSGVTIAIDLTYLRHVLDTARHLWGVNTDSSVVVDAKAKLKYLGISTRSKSRDRRPTPQELEQILEYAAKMPATKLPHADLINFAIASAMRASEITRITWDDLNTENRTVIIRDRKDPKAKDGNHQTIPLLGVAYEIVARQPRISDKIFPYSSHTMTTIFARICTALNIHDLHFHDLRHEGISRLFEQGYQIHEVALVSGHKSWDMLKRYTQLKPESLHRD